MLLSFILVCNFIFNFPLWKALFVQITFRFNKNVYESTDSITTSMKSLRPKTIERNLKSVMFLQVLDSVYKNSLLQDIQPCLFQQDELFLLN